LPAPCKPSKSTYLTVYKNQTYSKDNWEDLEDCQGRQKNQKTSVSGLYLLFASLFLHCCACELTAARYSTAQKAKQPKWQDASLLPHAGLVEGNCRFFPACNHAAMQLKPIPSQPPANKSGFFAFLQKLSLHWSLKTNSSCMTNHFKTLVLAYKYLIPAKALRKLVSRDLCGEAGEVYI